MANLKKRPETVANLPRHGHDLSKRVLFTSSCGHLLPVLYDYLNPGDKIRVGRDIFTRTQPLKTPAFIRLTEHIDYFFVPMKQINSYFGNSFYGISDFINPNDSTSSTGWTSPQVSPLVYLSDIRASLFANLHTDGKDDSIYYSKHYDEFGVPVEANVLRLCSMLGYSENVLQDVQGTSSKPIPTVNLNLFAVYQKIFMDYYRLTDWTANNPYSYSLNSYYKNGSFQPALDSIKGSYGEGMFRLRYRPLKKDYFTNVFPSPLFSNGASVSAYSPSAISPSSITDRGSLILSTLGVNKEFPFSSNFGGVASGGVAESTSDTIYSNEGDLYGEDMPITVSGLRTLFAWDRMMRITQRGGKHYDSQTLAHFGFSVPQGVSDEVYFLGSHSNRLQIGEIAATATTGSSGNNTSVLGQLAGRGASVNSSGKTITFTAPCHGYLMAIYSCVPDVDYAAQGIDRLNTYTSINDYYHSEFDRVGMVPMYKFEFLYNSTYATESSSEVPVNTSSIIGWNYRYYELKMKPDTVHGAFNYNLRNWAATRNNTFLSDNNSPVFGASGFYNSPRYLDNIFEWSFVDNSSSSNGVPVANASTNVIVGNPVLYSEAPVFTYDPLLHCIDFKYYKTSCMSPYGIPRI